MSAGRTSGSPIGVVGLGFVGVATAVSFAERGRPVLGYDIEVEKVDRLRKGEVPFFEEGLAEALARGRKRGRVRWADSLEELLERCETIFLCLPTPSHPDGSIDLSFLEAAVRQLGFALRERRGWRLFVVKSTVVPGTTSGKVAPLLAETSGRIAGKDFSVAASPEFLAEGSMMEDALHPARIVLGVSDRRSENLLRTGYRGFNCPILAMPPSAAELVKYASNQMLALRVSYANEVAGMAESAGVDSAEVLAAVGLDPRIGARFLAPGPGFGGSCFEKDLRALIRWAEERHLPPTLSSATLQVNDLQTRHIVELAEADGYQLKGKVVALLGLSFKANTSDTRGSRAYPLLEEMLRRGTTVELYDPVAMEPFRRGLPSSLARHLGTRVRFAGSLKECLERSDLALIHTDWEEFKTAPIRVWKLLRGRRIVDARRTLDPVALRRAEIEYRAVGHGRGGFALPD